MSDLALDLSHIQENKTCIETSPIVMSDCSFLLGILSGILLDGPTHSCQNGRRDLEIILVFGSGELIGVTIFYGAHAVILS